jgi:glycosyltransferase involved in cell wall biosynthesis
VVRRLARFFRENRVDVVHTHGYKANLLCGCAAKLSGAHVVKTEHGGLEPVEAFARIKLSLNLGLDRLMTPYLVDRIVYVSRDIRRRNGKHYERMHGDVIYNGIPCPPEAPYERPPEIDPSAFNLGIVGRLTAVKGHIHLLRALKELSTLNVRLYVLGDGELRSKLERFSQENGLAGRVSFLGFRDNLADYLRSLDALVMPSLHEGFPYAMLEAAYWGLPLIASRVGGIREVLRDRHECLLVEPRNVRQLADAIATLHGDGKLRARLGQTARRHVLNNFRADAMGQKYLAAYEQAVSQPANRRPGILIGGLQ